MVHGDNAAISNDLPNKDIFVAIVDHNDDTLDYYVKIVCQIELGPSLNKNAEPNGLEANAGFGIETLSEHHIEYDRIESDTRKGNESQKIDILNTQATFFARKLLDIHIEFILRGDSAPKLNHSPNTESSVVIAGYNDIDRLNICLKLVSYKDFAPILNENPKPGGL